MSSQSNTFRWTSHVECLGWLSAAAVCLILWDSSYAFTSLFLRQDAQLWHIVLGTLVLVAATWRMPNRQILIPIGLLAWVLFSAASIFWSLSPADSVTASGWHYLYLIAFIVGFRWPRQLFILLVVTHFAILLNSLDIVLVSGDTHLTGVWYNKNAQGSQFLLFVPILAAWAFRAKRWSPYIGFALGISLFAATLTASAAAQILLLLGIIAAIVLQFRHWNGRVHRLRVLTTVALVFAGCTLTWWTIRPEAVQVFGISIELQAGTTEGMPKTNTISSLSHRVEMIEYGLKAGIGAFPMGTGAGSLRNLYPGLKEQAGTNVSDLHNYYVQQFMELGAIGLILFVGVVSAAVWLSLRSRNWIFFIPLFLMAGYLAFDVPGYYPALMMGFLGLAGGAAASSHILTAPRIARAPGCARWVSLPAIVVSVLWSFWLVPCKEAECAIGRKLGAREVVTSFFNETTGSERRQVIDAAVELNPQSFWVYDLYTIHAMQSEPREQYLEAAITTSQIFPAASVTVYLDWYRAALANDDKESARRALRIGSTYYSSESIEEILGEGDQRQSDPSSIPY